MLLVLGLPVKWGRMHRQGKAGGSNSLTEIMGSHLGFCATNFVWIGYWQPNSGRQALPTGPSLQPWAKTLGSDVYGCLVNDGSRVPLPLQQRHTAIFSALFSSPICTSTVLFWGKLSVIGCPWVCSDSHIRSVRFTTNTSLRTVSPEFHTVVGFQCPFELKFIIFPFLGKKKSNFAKMYPLLPSSPLSQCHIKFTGQKKRYDSISLSCQTCSWHPMNADYFYQPQK